MLHQIVNLIRELSVGACVHIWKSIIYSKWKGNKRNIEVEEEEKIIYNFVLIFCFGRSGNYHQTSLAANDSEFGRRKKINRNWQTTWNDGHKREYQYRVSWLLWRFKRVRPWEWTVAVYKNGFKLIKFNFLSLHNLHLICFLHSKAELHIYKKKVNHFLQRFSIKVAVKVH